MPSGSVVMLVGPDSTIVAISRLRGEWVGRRAPAQAYRSFVSASGVPYEAIGLDGSMRVIAAAQMKHFGLRAGAGLPQNAVVAASEQRARNSALIAALVAIAALAVALIGARKLARPVFSLARSAQQFGEGDLDARADQALPGEFGLLAAEFNRALAAHRASEEARRAQAAAEAASQAKSQFLAHMSHEIRTPMNAIVGMTDLTLRTQLQPKQREYLGRVRAAAGSLLGIINDILDFSKIEAGKLELEQTDFRVQDVLDRVTSVVGLRAHEKGLELLMSTAADVPDPVRGDPLRLEQVLLNLCSNAVKFTDSGEIVVVTVKVVPSAGAGTTLRFTVRDTGTGMTEAQVASLCQPFNQLDASTTRRHGGTGLGLAISRQLVQLMGGEFQVRSQPGKGSEFSFTAVFQPAQQVVQRSRTESPSPALPAGFAVLVVDDSANARDIFRDLVEGLGGQATCVADGAQALDALRRQRFDVALVDWRLPDIDGFDLAERLGAQAPACPVLLVTAYGNDSVQRRAHEHGLRGCLFKPVSRQALRQALAAAFDKHQPASWQAPTAASELAEAPASLRGKRVLLVEDNEFNQIVAMDLLGSIAGVEVTLARNGREALAQLAGPDFDAVLMDVQMPEMDGCQAAQQVRAQPRHAALPIIAMTAHALASDRDRCLAAGMNDYLAKPFEPAELFAVLARWTSAGASANPPSNTNAVAHETSGVDFERGLHRCVGRRDLYHRIVSRFVDTRAQDPATMRAALADGDLDMLRFLAHTITSSAGTIGAARLSHLSRELQVALAYGEPRTALAERVDAFAQEHATVMRELKAHLAEARERAMTP
jgi:signal transduction histidine kinase/CheY-like chemotaxis protein/HPt (histidine-containing phosphotransfer) domain-containing protein